jgi:rSAM/selenodomain-associated transferase 1
VRALKMGLAILLFIKLPQPGQVKTRLASKIGRAEAAKIYGQLVATVLQRLPKWGRLIIMFDPPDRAQEVRAWIKELSPGDDLEFVAQVSGDLGARLEHAFAYAFTTGAEKAAVVGSDCIEIGPGTFTETERALETHECAIGPTFDGGYYLLALKRPCPSLFVNMAWSTETVFEETLARARAAGLTVHELARRYDVDTIEDWQRAIAIPGD